MKIVKQFIAGLFIVYLLFGQVSSIPSTVTGGGSGSTVTQFTATKSSSTALLVGTECSAATPCNTRQLNTEYAVTASCNPVVSAGTGTAYIYTTAGVVYVGHNGLTFTSNTGCTLASSITSFPAGSHPLWTWPATGGTWDATGQVDYRAQLDAPPTAGEGIAYSGTSVTVDRTTIPRWFSAAGAPSGAISGSRRGDTYINTSTGDTYVCQNPSADCTGVSSTHWIQFGLLPGGLLPLANGGTNCAAPYAVLPETGTYSITKADFACFKTVTVASGTFTLVLPAAGGTFPVAGTWVRIINYGSGVLTVSRVDTNINGGTTSLTIAAGSATAPTSLFVTNDGTNFFAGFM